MRYLKVGARGSPLSVAQTKDSIGRLEACFPHLKLELKTYETAGDIDRSSDLGSNAIPEDFFSDTLDKAVLEGEIDVAIHSAKDLPEKIQDRLDWFYLPWREDPRDGLVFPKDRPLPENPVIGVSSDSRTEYAKRRWPKGRVKGIRGNIGCRIRQVDEGDFDVAILALAGLNRLGLKKRISEVIPLDELQTHEAQGAIALTFKMGHPILSLMKRCLINPVMICGAGTGRDGNYSVAVSQALAEASLCLKDSLMENEILRYCKGRIVEVGKRYHDNAPGEKQKQMIDLTLDAVKKGEKVVRLKGGDPSLFGRLSEEIEALTRENIPFKILPGIPWICSAPIQHGIYLTERNHIRSFIVATGTEIDGKTLNLGQIHQKSPIYFLMATRKLAEIVRDLIEQGYPSDTPISIFRETPGEENRISATLANIESIWEKASLQPPAIVMIGIQEHSVEFERTLGPLSGKKILCSGTANTKAKIESMVMKLGGQCEYRQTFDLKLSSVDELEPLKRLAQFDWIFFASGSSVEKFIEGMHVLQLDFRTIPKIAVSGPTAEDALKKHGLKSDFIPSQFTSQDLAKEIIVQEDVKGKKVMVMRSSASESPMAKMLSDAGAQVESVTLYINEAITLNDPLKDFDVAVFCSPSSVKAMVNAHRDQMEQATCIASIGPITTEALKKDGIEVHVEAKVFDVEHLMYAIVSHFHLE